MWATSTLEILLNPSIEMALNIALNSRPLIYKSEKSFLTIFHRQLDPLIKRFQKIFHLHFPVGIIIPIKVERDHKRVTIFHESRGQDSTQGKIT